MISRITCLKSRMMCTNAVQCTCSDYVSNILENKTTFLFVFIECKQNFAYYHPCFLLSPIEDEMTFRSKVNTVTCFVDWNDFLLLDSPILETLHIWVCSKCVHNFTFHRNARIKKYYRSKKITKHQPIYTKHGYFRIRISVIECWCSSWHQYLTNGTIDAFRFSDSAYSAHNSAVWCITCYSIEMIYYALEASK